jgi:hypothetical protein
MRFAPKRDLIPTVVAWGGVVIQAVAAAFVFFNAYREGAIDSALWLIFAVPFAAWIFLVIFPLLSTVYEITPTALIIRFGWQRTVIPMRDILEVTATKKMLRLAWNNVWSLDRLLVRYRTAKGTAPLPVAIAPADKAAFLRELERIVPDLKVVND